MNVDDELVRGCAAEWEPGEVKTPRWLAAMIAMLAGAGACALVTVILAASALLNPAR